MAGNVKNMGLTSLDDLFKSEEERQQDSRERILNIPIEELHPYARQPYSVERPTPDLVRLMDSIEQVGVAEPLIVRPRTEGGYEILSGHRRDYCARVVGLQTLPVIVREYTDDEADILVVDYNITREDLLPSEKANTLLLQIVQPAGFIIVFAIQKLKLVLHLSQLCCSRRFILPLLCGINFRLQLGAFLFGMTFCHVILGIQLRNLRLDRRSVVCLLLTCKRLERRRCVGEQRLLFIKLFLQLCPLVFGLLHLAIQHQPVFFQLFERITLVFQVDFRHFQPVVPQDAAHVLTELCHDRFMRYRRKILLDQLAAAAAQYLGKIQGVEQGQNEITAAEAFGKAFLRGRCAVHGKNAFAVMPHPADLMRLAVVRADKHLHPEKGGVCVVQMVEITSTKERRAGQGVSDRVCDRTFALRIVACDCGHRTESPFLLGGEPAETGDLQRFDLQ